MDLFAFRRLSEKQKKKITLRSLRLCGENKENRIKNIKLYKFSYRREENEKEVI